MSAINNLTLSPSQLLTSLSEVAKAGLVANIEGDPGVGKSMIVDQFSSIHNMKMIDTRLSQREPVDLSGYPMLDPKTGRMIFAPPEDIPLATDNLPRDDKGNTMNGWVLFLDEFNSASRQTASAAYKLILDRYVGTRKVHPRVIMVAAGNKASNRAITNDLGTAMQSRLVHMTLKVNNQDWLDWAVKAGIDHRVIAFIKFKPNLLHSFKATHNDKTFPCPRTWHFCSNYIKPVKKFDHRNLVVMAGTVSQGAAVEFKTFTKIYGQMPTIDSMIADPEGFKIKDEPSFQHAISTMVGANFENAPSQLIRVIERLPLELQVVSLREAVARNEKVIDIPEVEQWNEDHAEQLF